MRSFISNFDPVDSQAVVILRRATITLLVCAIGLILVSEFGIRGVVYRTSKNLSRIHQEALAAAQIRGVEEGAQQVLLIGNSLLLNDVNVEELERRLSPGQNIKQFAIQATTYYDWYYGVRGLLAEGSHPDLIVVCFEARHLLLSSVRSEIFAYYLMQRQDLLDVSHRLKSTAADTFDLLLANISILYALRKELRQVLLQRLLTELPQLTAMIARSPKPLPDPALLRTIGKDRLITMRDLAVLKQTQLVLLVMPPVYQDSLEVLREIGREIGMPVLVPLDSYGIDDSDYQADGYHLNEQGRDKFTKALLPLLAQMRKRANFSN